MATIFDPQEEILEYFDEQGSPLGTKSRKQVCDPIQEYYEWHKVANVWLVNRKGQLLCTKRSLNLAGSPGKWQSYVGGHIKAGVSPKQGAAMEAEEEVGVNIDEKDVYLIDAGKYEPWKHFYETYAYLYDGDIKDLVFADGEVIEAKWMSFDEYNQDHSSHPDNWCCGCSLQNQERIKEWLKQINA